MSLWKTHAALYTATRKPNTVRTFSGTWERAAAVMSPNRALPTLLGDSEAVKLKGNRARRQRTTAWLVSCGVFAPSTPLPFQLLSSA